MALQGSQWQAFASRSRCPQLCVAVMMVIALCFFGESRSFVSGKPVTLRGGTVRGSTSSVPSPPARAHMASAASSSSMSSVAALALVGSLALLKPRTRGSGETPKVVMQARNDYPTTPTGDSRTSRRMRAGRMRSILDGRQIAVRVNRKTNKSIKFRMHVMPGDIVQIMKGKDKGKVTEVLRIYPKWNRILCLGVNYCIKHVRPQREDEVGQRVQVEAPMHSSCVMHYDPEEQIAGPLGIRFEKRVKKSGGKEYVKKVRFNKATGNDIPKRDAKKWVPVLDRDEDEDE
ncbi:unnamed protein product [Durusdinium trenchii]|uniref:Large ribosomal subunit protein uL24c n=2 Tax=Durusdinium trenchii TaxID=1381693 RepID=A0ABP0MCJ8_9DINO